jgi:hypothetical protein
MKSMTRSKTLVTPAIRGLLAGGLALALGVSACSTQGDGNPAPAPTTQTAPVAAATSATSDPGSGALLARITNQRYDEAVRDLLGVPTLATTLPADATNVFAPDTFEKYFNAADALGEQVFSNPLLKSRLLTCEPTADASCTRSLVTSIAARAWNGPVAPSDVDRLTQLANDAVAMGETPVDSIKQVVKTVLASPQFLYQVAPAPAQQL